jgi:hypothetical protein
MGKLILHMNDTHMITVSMDFSLACFPHAAKHLAQTPCIGRVALPFGGFRDCSCGESKKKTVQVPDARLTTEQFGG